MALAPSARHFWRTLLGAPVLAWLLKNKVNIWLSAVVFVPFSLSDGNVGHWLRLSGIEPVRQLGQGVTAEIWLARVLGRDHDREEGSAWPGLERQEEPVVVKLVSGRAVWQYLLLDNALASSPPRECETGRVLRMLQPQSFVNCSAYGRLHTGGARLEFTIHEWVLGQNIYDQLRPAPLAPPPALGSLRRVLDLTLRIFKLMDEGLRPPPGRGVRYVLRDLSLRNLMVTDDGSQLRAVDYDRAELCCEPTRKNCPWHWSVCNEQFDDFAIWGNIRLLARNFLEMLIGQALRLPSWTFVHHKWFTYEHWLLHLALTVAGMPPSWVPSNTEQAVAEAEYSVHPAYLREWREVRLCCCSEALRVAFVALRRADLTWPPRFVLLLQEGAAALH